MFIVADLVSLNETMCLSEGHEHTNNYDSENKLETAMLLFTYSVMSPPGV